MIYVCVVNSNVRNINRELIPRVTGTSELLILSKGMILLVIYWSCFRDGVFLPIGDHGVFGVGYFSDPKVRYSSHCDILSLLLHHHDAGR